MEAAGLKIRRSNMMYWSKEFPFLFADVDRLIVGEDAGLECKTASASLTIRINGKMERFRLIIVSSVTITWG